MTTVLLVLALTGQLRDCPTGVCPTAPPKAAVTSAVESAWRKIAVRVEAVGPKYTGWGSGVLVASDGRMALVLTNRHVVRGSTKVIVHRGNQRYAANVLRIASDGDIAALEIASPIRQYSMRIATAPALTGFLFGFDGSTGQFHAHAGRFTTSDAENDSYAYHTHEGESGSPVINERGELTGIAWGTRTDATESPAVSLARLRAFLATETCFRFFRRNPRQIININQSERDPIPAVPTPAEPSPAPPNQGTVTAPGPVAIQPAVDLSPILSRLAAVEQLAALNAVQVRKPITFLDPKPDGTETAMQARLGDSVRLKIPTPVKP